MAAAVTAVAAESKFHVLAVDDSLIDRKVIERLLKTSSYQVTTVDSGSKALEFLGFQDDDEHQQTCCNHLNFPSVSSHNSNHQNHASLSPTKKEVDVSLVITDYCMPGMTGYDLLRKIKESSSLRNIPVVIMSSENVTSRISRCLEEGAEEFFLKPVRLSDVNKLKSHMLKAKCGNEDYHNQFNHDEDSSTPPKLQELHQPLQQQYQQHKKELDQTPHETESRRQDIHLLVHHQSQQQLLLPTQPLPPPPASTVTNNNNKRKSTSSSSTSMDEELSPDTRTRPRYSGLSVA